MKKFLIVDGAVLLFHLNDPRIFKEIRFYLESYSFHNYMKWEIVNSFPLASLEDP
jgi:hypothetical protein